MTRLLILTMHSGERELPFVQQSLQIQNFPDWTHRLISGLDNKSAHQELYSTIHAEAHNFDRFLKLDADMVLRTPDALLNMLRDFSAEPEIDHAYWPVLDFYSNRNMYAVHMFSNRAKWRAELPDFFVDPDPAIVGRRLAIPLSTFAPVFHAPFPSPRQAFEFGLHRAKKWLAPASKASDWMQKVGQLRTLQEVWKAFLHSGDVLRGLAVYGAECARRGLQYDAYKNNPLTNRIIEEAIHLTSQEIMRKCSRFWSYEVKISIIKYRLKIRQLDLKGPLSALDSIPYRSFPVSSS
jgi:hypothetical protein